MIRRLHIREQSGGYRYDSFDVARPGTYVIQTSSNHRANHQKDGSNVQGKV
jgi:hypothetical protein